MSSIHGNMSKIAMNISSEICYDYRRCPSINNEDIDNNHTYRITSNDFDSVVVGDFSQH
jgi:hypothetical protein